MRLILVLLVLACIAIQYPLRMGGFGYKRVDELNQQLQAQRETNKAMMARNNAMQAEIDDLQTGTQALEDYARQEMSMVESNEVLVRILDNNEEIPPATIRIGPKGASNTVTPDEAVRKPGSLLKPMPLNKEKSRTGKLSAEKSVSKPNTTKPHVNKNTLNNR